MFRYLLFLFITFSVVGLEAQTIPDKLNTAWLKFMGNEQLQYSTAGICVMDAKTGKIVFGRNENMGMAPASTQKIFTTVAAFEALGKDYKYQTNIGYTGYISEKKLIGNLIVEGSGDPTLGSWRYAASKGNAQIITIAKALKQLGVDTITGKIIELDKGFDINPVPQDWMWGDMGNYYGAGHWALNWAENQYDVHLTSGATGTNTIIKKTDIKEEELDGYIHNEITSGDANTGDETIIYTAPFSPFKLLQGKISSNKNSFPISGSFSFADRNALVVMKNILKTKGVIIEKDVEPTSNKLIDSDSVLSNKKSYAQLITIQSPNLDSIIYWFLKKSINLYGEGLLRTIGLEKNGYGSTENGLKWVDSFYTANKIDIREKHMRDGSGLSPTNRVTPTALVLALQLAKTKSWFPSFYDALPIYNGMKLKSGTIHRTKCYAGYHTSKDGKQYIVSLMVNNYNGETSSLIEKMFLVLDILK